MPHDNKKQPLAVGDRVDIPCVVKAIHLSEEYCNVELESVVAMWPTEQRNSITLNSRQVVKQETPVTLSVRDK